MSPDERALRSAVAAAPADDLPRLVYADWLDEHGRPVRAEFIRLQCEIARLEAGPRSEMDKQVGLWKRQQALLDDHLSELLGPGNEPLADFRPVFDRGFLAELTAPAARFVDHGESIAGLFPVPRVTVTGVADRLADFLDRGRPYLDTVSAVEMQAKEFTYPVRLNQYRASELRLRARWRRLTSLHMEGCRIGDQGVTHTFRDDAFPVLTDLDLSQNDITDDGIVGLIDWWDGVHRLTKLILGGNPLTDQSAFELADRLGPNNRLEYLNLRFTNITAAGQQALLRRFGGKLDLF